MHEFELGVWKGLFVHLVRLLNAVDNSIVVEMDRQYVFRPPPEFVGSTEHRKDIVKFQSLVGERYDDSLQTLLK
jgi:predicted transcriptional regulator